MKRSTLIALIAAVMVMASSAVSFAADGLKVESSYPENGQKNMSMENLGVKLTFNHPINSDEAKAVDESKFSIVDEDGEKVPVQVLFSDANDGLVLVVADVDKGFVAKNNCEYKLTIDAGLIDNEGNELAAPETITFRTYNQRVNNMVNMGMMFVMFGGIMFLTMRQNNKEEDSKDSKDKKDEAKEAFNPYKEAKRTGKTVEEVKAEQARKEEKEAKKKARKKKKNDTPAEKKIENCAEYLNNVYHVHAPAPVNKADRSVNALNTLRREEARAERAAKAAEEAARKKKRNR